MRHRLANWKFKRELLDALFLNVLMWVVVLLAIGFFVGFFFRLAQAFAGT